jgi:hypothetical protein
LDRQFFNTKKNIPLKHLLCNIKFQPVIAYCHQFLYDILKYVNKTYLLLRLYLCHKNKFILFLKLREKKSYYIGINKVRGY